MRYSSHGCNSIFSARTQSSSLESDSTLLERVILYSYPFSLESNPLYFREYFLHSRGNFVTRPNNTIIELHRINCKRKNTEEYRNTMEKNAWKTEIERIAQFSDLRLKKRESFYPSGPTDSWERVGWRVNSLRKYK